MKLSRGDLVGGLTTFFTMAYIVVVNPAILASPGTGMTFNGVLTATVLLSASMTLLMGVYARLPFAVAPGMGINAFFTFSLILGQKIPWQTALGMVFWAGVLFLLVSLTPLRERIAEAIPEGLRCSAATGIGIFLSFIGLKNMGLVVGDPVTLLKLGRLDGRVGLGILGLVLTIVLMRKKNPFAFLAGIFVVTILAWLFGYTAAPATIFSPPDFSTVFFKLDIWGALRLAFLPAIVSVMLTDLFDSLSSFVGVGQATGMVAKDGKMPRLREGLIVDAWATLGAGLVGTSSGTAYIESAAGIEAGGRTGMAAVVTALCFLPCFFIGPLAAMVPGYATAPILIIVGALMFRTVSLISFDKLEDAIPNYLTILLIPFTFSITQGILWGFLAHVLLYWLAGRRREIKPLLYGIAGVAALLLVLEQLG